MTQLHVSEKAVNESARNMGCLVSIPMALAVGGLLVYLAASFGASLLLPAYPWAVIGVAAVTGFIVHHAVQKRLTTRRNRILAQRLAESSVAISATALHPGDTFDVMYCQQVLEMLELRQMRIDLVRRMSEADPFIWTLQRDRIEDTVTQPGGEFPPGSFLRWKVDLKIPDNAGRTFMDKAFSRQVDWLIRVRLRLAQGPDYIAEFPLSPHFAQS